MSDVTIGDPSGGIRHSWRYVSDISNDAPVLLARRRCHRLLLDTCNPRGAYDWSAAVGAEIKFPIPAPFVLSPHHGCESPVKLIPANL
jgi:hypothetical protein